MKILHVLFTGEAGGIEKLNRDIGINDPNNNVFCFLYEGGIMCEEMKALGLKVIEFNINKRNYFKAYKSLKNICEKFSFRNIVIHHNGPSLWIPSYILKFKKPELNIFLYAHGSYNNFIQGRKFREFIFKYSVKKCTNIIAISDFVKNTIEQNCIESTGKIMVNYNGVDSQEFFVERDDKFTDPLRLIYVGRLIPDKGVSLLIDAVASLKIPYELEIVGHGIDQKKIEEKIKKYNLEEKIYLRGKQRDIAKRNSQSDIFIHPAILEEGFGITIVEAMNSGLICIGFKKGALPEIIENNVTGFLVEDISSEGLSDAIYNAYNLLKQDNLIKMRQMAQKRAEKFNISNTVLGLKHIILRGDSKC